jgi:hypothetical protein
MYVLYQSWISIRLSFYHLKKTNNMNKRKGIIRRAFKAFTWLFLIPFLPVIVGHRIPYDWLTCLAGEGVLHERLKFSNFAYWWAGFCVTVVVGLMILVSWAIVSAIINYIINGIFIPTIKFRRR